jgi:CSLREA domain-containing protein
MKRTTGMSVHKLNNHRRLRKIGITGLGCLACSIAASLSASTIAVNTIADVVAVDGVCSLREAVSAVNNHAASGNMAGECVAGDANNDTIILPAGIYPIALAGSKEDNNATGDLDIRASLKVQGASMGSTIIYDVLGFGATPDRIFDLPVSGVNVSFQDMTIEYGHAPDGTPGTVMTRVQGENGGAIRIQNATVTLTRVLVTQNTAGMSVGSGSSRSYGGSGGAIATNGGTLQLVKSIVSQNIAGTSSSGGGGIYAYGAVLVDESQISGNDANDGSGGGIQSYQGSALFVTRSSISGNTARFGGGLAAFNTNSLNLSNSTIIGNNTTYQGGGVFFSRTHARLDFVTITGNTGTGVTFNDSDGTFATNIRNSIIAGNIGPTDCFQLIANTLVSDGYNLAGTGCPSNGTGDIVATNPKLGPLTLDASGTQIIVPHPDSPAINAGNCVASGIFTDQRGHNRPAAVPRVSNVADGCDIGAIELDDDIFWHGLE